MSNVLSKVKPALVAVAAYLRENPGAASLIGGWAVLVLAKFGLHVTYNQLAAIATLLLPLVVGGHLAARKSRQKVALKAAVAEKAATETPAA